MSLTMGRFEADGSTVPAGHAVPRSRMKGPDVLDLSHLRTYTLGAVELEREILELFVAELPKSLTGLTAANNSKSWHMAAHTIKGSALAVGAGQLAAAGAVAERIRFDASAERRQSIADITAAIARVTAEIARLKAS